MEHPPKSTYFYQPSWQIHCSNVGSIYKFNVATGPMDLPLGNLAFVTGCCTAQLLHNWTVTLPACNKKPLTPPQTSLEVAGIAPPGRRGCQCLGDGRFLQFSFTAPAPSGLGAPPNWTRPPSPGSSPSLTESKDGTWFSLQSALQLVGLGPRFKWSIENTEAFSIQKGHGWWHQGQKDKGDKPTGTSMPIRGLAPSTEAFCSLTHMKNRHKSQPQQNPAVIPHLDTCTREASLVAPA